MVQPEPGPVRLQGDARDRIRLPLRRILDPQVQMAKEPPSAIQDRVRVCANRLQHRTGCILDSGKDRP
jgi:hypothetical protein